ncbi:G-protein coupled receptor moody [Holothuria leucospilota]|uniref:G-protein coupled receptor moody n=1 Tax=Holothuria leucospilota TaxID=206669 RepID=A0A9Q0YIV6_HOLLE|nr:G-protein coupled receptor moody [Holothuria leucospilota]
MEVGSTETPSVDGPPTHSSPWSNQGVVPWSDDFVFDNPTQRIIIAIAACLITVIGIPGNIMVILAVMLSKKLQNKTNVFVVNLACADMLTCAVLPFQAVSLLNETPPLPSFLCRMVAIFVWLGVGSSVVNLALIAFIRYSLITKSRSYSDRLLTKPKLSLFICGAWFVPFLIIVLPLPFDVGYLGYSPTYKMCTGYWKDPLSEISTVIDLFIAFLCLIVIMLCYVKIYRFVRNAGRNLIQPRNSITINEDPESSRTAPLTSTEVAIFRRQVEVTKNLFIVVCTYVICVMPYGFSNIPGPKNPFVPWTILLLYMNSCLNPIIYGLKHPQFKEVFWAIITCSWRNIPEPSLVVSFFCNIST